MVDKYWGQIMNECVELVKRLGAGHDKCDMEVHS